jgi:hypothetical protein
MNDGIVMPTLLPTATGPPMQDAYYQIFKALRLK